MVSELCEDTIASEAVAAAFLTVPRHVFAPDEPLAVVYDVDTPLVTKTGPDVPAHGARGAAGEVHAPLPRCRRRRSRRRSPRRRWRVGMVMPGV